MKKILLLPLSVILLSACMRSSVLDPLIPKPEGKTDDGWKEYAETPLAGRLFARDWTAKRAIAKAFFSEDSNELMVKIYADELGETCESLGSSKQPYATVVIPKNYTTAEYKTETSSGSGHHTPVVFTLTESSSENIISDKSKIRIETIGTDRFTASIFAVGVEENGIISEINGRIEVIDCTKVMNLL
jgi:hypothetical protein